MKSPEDFGFSKAGDGVWTSGALTLILKKNGEWKAKIKSTSSSDPDIENSILKLLNKLRYAVDDAENTLENFKTIVVEANNTLSQAIDSWESRPGGPKRRLFLVN